MNIIFEISRYIIFIIIGIILIIWYLKKKGWDGSFKTSLIFNFIWKTLIFFIFLGFDLLIEEWLSNNYYIFFYIEIIYLLITILRFFINIFLGITFFKIIYKQKMQESTVIILIIVIIEIILENIILSVYPFLYYLSLL